MDEKCKLAAHILLNENISGEDYDNMTKEEACVLGMKHILSLPLIERLTDAEKKRVHEFMETEVDNPCDAIDAVEFVNDLFGDDLFKEEVKE